MLSYNDTNKEKKSVSNSNGNPEEGNISSNAAVLNDIVKRKILRLAEKIKNSQNKNS